MPRRSPSPSSPTLPINSSAPVGGSLKRTTAAATASNAATPAALSETLGPYNLPPCCRISKAVPAGNTVSKCALTETHESRVTACDPKTFPMLSCSTLGNPSSANFATSHYERSLSPNGGAPMPATSNCHPVNCAPCSQNHSIAERTSSSPPRPATSPRLAVLGSTPEPP